MINKHFHIFILTIILLLGFSLRIHRLSDIPHGFFADEASIGYNAYTILQTEKDEYGINFPIFFRSFGDYRHPISVYSAIPFIQIFGLTETSIRLNSILYGIITILSLYFLGKEVTSKNYGLWAAFIASFMPWLIHYNRTGFEFSAYAAFFILSVLFVIKSIKNKKYVIFTFLFFGLTFYTYQPAKLIVPLFLLGVIFILRKNFLENKKIFLISLLIFFLISTPLFLSFINGNGFARFNQVSIFSSHLPLLATIKHIVSNYIYQFSFSFLITEGEPTFINRHFTQGFVPILPITFPFLLLGIFTLIRNLKQKFHQVLLLWLFIYPVGASVVSEAPFSSRCIIGAPLFVLIIALGIQKFISIFNKIINKNIIISIIIVLILLTNLGLFLKFYFIKYPLYSSDFWGWQYGPKEIMNYLLKNKNKYDELYMSGEFNGSYIFLKFYDPENICQNKCLLGDFFINEKIYDQKKRQLFSLSPEYLNKSKFKNKFLTKKIVYYPNKSIAFIIGEVVQ